MIRGRERRDAGDALDEQRGSVTPPPHSADRAPQFRLCNIDAVANRQNARSIAVIHVISIHHMHDLAFV